MSYPIIALGNTSIGTKLLALGIRFVSWCFELYHWSTFMKLRIACTCLLLALVFSCQQNPSSTEIAEQIGLLLQGSEMDASLVDIYEQNEFKPIWVKSGGLTNTGEEYFEELEEVSLDGLVKEDYLLEEQLNLLEKLKNTEDPAIHAQLDLAISRSFLLLASDLNVGKINPADLNIEWKMARKEPTIDYPQLMLSLAKGTSLEEALDQLRPTNARYHELRELLRKQKELKQDETGVVQTIDGKIEKGDNHKAIPAIRKKLQHLNDLKEAGKGEEEVYDQGLFEAVKIFQQRHGLIDDGIIGTDFVEAINYSHQDLMSKIVVNMERLRWLPDFSEHSTGKVIVNIPDFSLYYIQEDDTVLTSKVVVGKDYRQTPVFKSEMTYLVFSPTWTLPETILWEDAIPSIQKDKNYLVKNNMRVLDKQENEVDIKKVNWNDFKNKGDFPYLIRQAPGVKNPLGKVKFMFPNDYSIYIHDSPAQQLFLQDQRTFSSGCIRMENPGGFASILLENAEDWDENKIAEAMNQEDEQVVNLKDAQDVWILYLTVWNSHDKVEVREDIYDMDRKLAKALSLPISEHFL